MNNNTPSYNKLPITFLIQHFLLSPIRTNKYTNLIGQRELEAEVSDVVFGHVVAMCLEYGDFAESLLLQVPKLQGKMWDLKTA